MGLFTIGHSNHSIEKFIDLNRQHGVTAIADVRSYPYSKFCPQFNQQDFRKQLKAAGIAYVFLGEELGAKPQNRACYQSGQAVYELIAQTEAFQQGLQRLSKGLKKYKIALVCAEKDPLTCHRAVLICQHIRHSHPEIYHILEDGDLESHESLENRMLDKHKFRNFIGAEIMQPSLFPDESLPSREDCLQEAYRLQGQKTAYREEQQANEEN